MGHGYMGKVLWVDLSRGTVTTESIADDLYARFLSGTGLASRLLLPRIPPGADALGPDNILGFVCGLLTGTGSLFTGRWMVVGKSPLTGTWGDANCGGNLAPGIKGCGVDGIFFTGVSERPVYLYADTRGAAIHDAGHLWGKDALETERLLVETHGKKQRVRVACIGMAGERRSLIAGIVNHGGRLAARSGLGAVMGAKRLKAVVLCGAHRVQVHDRARIKTLSQACNRHVAFQPPFLSGTMTAYMGALMRVMPAQVAVDGMLYKIMLKKWGTVNQNRMAVEIGDAPVMNWRGSNRDFGLDQSEATDPDRFTRPVVAKYFCYSCPLGCGGITLSPDGRSEGHRPEYETAIALGGLCLNKDADSIYTLNDLLNRAGMDTISVGGTVAFAIECFEKGLLSLADTDGLALTWGDSRAIVKLVEKMVRREGIGDLLADGARRAAEKIGRGAGELAIHAGGQELGMHDGRFDPGFALHNVVEPTPGRHTIGAYMYYEMFQLWRRIVSLPDPSAVYRKSSKYRANREKAVMGSACSRYMNVINGAGGCLFGAFLGAHRIPFFDWLNAATGWDLSPEAYLTIGHRIQTVKQLFNIRQGVAPRSIRISRRVLGDPPQAAGANRGRRVPLEKLRRYYWREMGYDIESGVPTADCLRQLGLDQL